jgi:6-phosphogluconolactonase
MKKNLAFLLIIMFFIHSNAQQNHVTLLVGTYTSSCKSDGIYVYDFNTDTAEFQLQHSTENVINPSYLSVSDDNKFIYSVNENGANSSISSFSFDAKNRNIKFLNKQDSKGADPCYIINDDKNVIAANYSGGNISVFGKTISGKLAPAKQVLAHYGKSVDRKRQESPHVHTVMFSPDRKYVLANDLGTDRIYVYKYNADSKTEVLSFKDSIPIKSGSGPRHLTFSPDGKFVYLLQELDGSLSVFAYQNGYLRIIQETTVVAKDFKGENGAADIHTSNDGKFLYATNRGEANTISVFAIDAKGRLSHKQIISSGGKGPRNFAIAPGEKFVLIGNQNSNEIVIFERNSETGELTNTGKKINLCAPVCLVFTKKQ